MGTVVDVTTYLRADVAVAMAAVLVAAPPVPASAIGGPPRMSTTTHEIHLAATVYPGGLITSFVRNQGTYCSIICPLLAQTGITALTTTLGSPAAFLAALPRDGLLKAIGEAAASVTGPTGAALQKAIAADAAIPAQRALNAFEVGVVGLLDIAASLRGGPAAVLSAIGRARQQTFDALNAPVVPNPAPTVTPHGVLQMAVVHAINIVGAVIFPAFNEVLAGVLQVPDAMAQRLAATGDPVSAVGAGVSTAIGVVRAAVAVIRDAVVAAGNRAAPSAAPSAAASAAPSERSLPNKADHGRPAHRRPTHDVKASHPAGQKGPSGTGRKAHGARPAHTAGR